MQGLHFILERTHSGQQQRANCKLLARGLKWIIDKKKSGITGKNEVRCMADGGKWRRCR